MSGKLGQTVEYKVIVKNTGNVPLKFAALKDTACEGISPSGTTELAAGKEETFTCTHKLAAVGSYTNEASIEGNEGTGTKTSNKVIVKVPAEPSFTIEKHQKIEGEASYRREAHRQSSARRSNTRSSSRTPATWRSNSALSKTPTAKPSRPTGTTELESGEERPTPAATNSAVGSYTNEASIEGNEGTGTKTSNKVVAKVIAEPSYTIEKQQKVKAKAPSATGEASGKIGQTVEYKIIVKNTGNVTLKFSALTDTSCTGTTPSGATELKAGEEDLHLHALALGGRQLRQRSLDRRQRRHRQKDVQQSHHQSPGRTVLHHREAAAHRRRRVPTPR